LCSCVIIDSDLIAAVSEAKAALFPADFALCYIGLHVMYVEYAVDELYISM